MGGLKRWFNRVSTLVHTGIDLTRADENDREEMHAGLDRLHGIAAGLVLGERRPPRPTVRVEVVDKREKKP